MNILSFAERVRAAREQLGFTQAEMGDAVGVGAQTVSNWECGRSLPWPKVQLRVLDKIAVMLGAKPARRRVSDLI